MLTQEYKQFVIMEAGLFMGGTLVPTDKDKKIELLIHDNILFKTSVICAQYKGTYYRLKMQSYQVFKVPHDQILIHETKSYGFLCLTAVAIAFVVCRMFGIL